MGAYVVWRLFHTITRLPRISSVIPSFNEFPLERSDRASAVLSTRHVSHSLVTPQALEESRVRPLNFHNISFFLSRPLCKKVSHSLHFIIFNMFGHEKIYRFIHYVWKASERLKVNRSRGVYQARQKGAQKLYIRIKCRFTHGCQYSW